LSAPSADEAADGGGGDSDLLRFSLSASLARAQDDRLLHSFSDNLSSRVPMFGEAVQPLVDGLVNIAETKSLARLASRKLKPQDPLMVGFPVVECNANHLDDVLSPREGETKGVGVAVFYLDAETTQFYIRQHYAQVPSMSQEKTDAASEQEWEALCATVAKQGSYNRVVLLSHLDQTLPHGFSISTCTYPESGATIEKYMVRNALSTCAPSALKTT
jgi:hypothetical protein